MSDTTKTAKTKLRDCVLIYNPLESYSDKIATKLSGTIIEVTQRENTTALKITKVASSSPAAEKDHAVSLCARRGDAATVFVITEDILVGVARGFLDNMIHSAIPPSSPSSSSSSSSSSSPDNPRVVTVHYKVHHTDIPSPLTTHPTIDYEAASFIDDFKKIVKGWLEDSSEASSSPSNTPSDVNQPQIPSSENDNQTTSLPMDQTASPPINQPDSSVYKLPCSITIEVHPTKGSKQKNKAADMRTIRDSLDTMLKTKHCNLVMTLMENYGLFVKDVSQNPLKIIGRVKDEEMWRKLQSACEDRSLGSLFLQHLVTHLQKDLAYELKLIAQKDEEVPPARSLSPVTSIVAGIIFDMITKKEYTTYDFHQKLLSFRDKMDLRSVRSDPDGYNPLHAIIVHNRLPLMLPLIHLQLFSAYLHDTVPLTSPSSFRGHTPRQIAEAKKARRFKSTLSEHERLLHSMSKFLKACHDADIALVRRLIHAQKQLVEERDSFKNNCLYWALVSNNLDLFNLLLDNKADYSNLNESKESLLHVACMLGHHKFIPVLMTRCKQDATAVCSNKRTALERVAENGDIECLKELIKHKVFLTTCVLPYAAANGRLPFIRYVLEESGQNVHVDSRDNTGRSALMKACETGRRDVVDYLLAKGASVNVEDLRHRTPLHVACENGHEDIVTILLDRDAALDVQDCYTGAELCFLIRGRDQGRAAWHYVEVRRNVVHIFLQKTRAGQVDVAVYGTVVKSGWGEEPDKSVVEWVEKMFSDRRSSASAAADLTPLLMAIYKQHPHVARLLINKGANINSKDHFGLTPYLMCALRNDVDTAKLLEEKGARTDDRDKEGHSALQIAEMNNQKEMINYLKGKTYLALTQDYVTDSLAKVQQVLEKSHLEDMRKQGTDVRRHIIDTVRELTTANNLLLMDMGSGPIAKASTGIEPPRSTAPEASRQPVRATDSGLGPSEHLSSAIQQSFGSTAPNANSTRR